MKMSYRIAKGKYVICKNGVYFSLTKDEVGDFEKIISDIKSGKKEFYKEDAR